MIADIINNANLYVIINARELNTPERIAFIKFLQKYRTQNSEDLPLGLLY